MNVPEKVLQGRTTEWSATVDSAWPLLVYITDCCTSKDTPVLWTHTTHSSHSELQSLLKTASDHSLECSSAREQPGSPEGEPGPPDGAASSPVSLGSDPDGPSDYSPPAVGEGGTPQREAPAWEAPDNPVFSPLPYTPLGSAEMERMLRRSQAETVVGDEHITPDVRPLPCTPLSSAEVRRMLKRARKQPRTARQLAGPHQSGRVSTIFASSSIGGMDGLVVCAMGGTCRCQGFEPRFVRPSRGPLARSPPPPP